MLQFKPHCRADGAERLGRSRKIAAREFAFVVYGKFRVEPEQRALAWANSLIDANYAAARLQRNPSISAQSVAIIRNAEVVSQ